MTLKEAQLKTVWRYRNTYPAAIEALINHKIDLSSLRIATFDFDDADRAFNNAMTQKDTVVKALILLPKE